MRQTSGRLFLQYLNTSMCLIDLWQKSILDLQEKTENSERNAYRHKAGYDQQTVKNNISKSSDRIGFP